MCKTLGFAGDGALPVRSLQTVWWEAEEETGPCCGGERSTKEGGLPRCGRNPGRSGIYMFPIKPLDLTTGTGDSGPSSAVSRPWEL